MITQTEHQHQDQLHPVLKDKNDDLPSVRKTGLICVWRNCSCVAGGKSRVNSRKKATSLPTSLQTNHPTAAFTHTINTDREKKADPTPKNFKFQKNRASLWRKILFVVIYALLYGAKIDPKILSVEQKGQLSCMHPITSWPAQCPNWPQFLEVYFQYLCLIFTSFGRAGNI